MASVANGFFPGVNGNDPGRSQGGRSRHASVSSEMARLWTQGSMSSLNLRPSRASSVISTRTKTSIATVPDELVDAFDVHATGGVVYRIGLDGRVVSIDNQAKGSRASTDTEPSLLDSADSIRSLVIDGSESDLAAANVAPRGPTQAPDLGRAPSFAPGPERLTVTRPRAASNPGFRRGNSPRQTSAETASSPIRRRGGLRPKVAPRESSSPGARPPRGATTGAGLHLRQAESPSLQPRTPDDPPPDRSSPHAPVTTSATPSAGEFEGYDWRVRQTLDGTCMGTGSRSPRGFSNPFVPDDAAKAAWSPKGGEDGGGGEGASDPPPPDAPVAPGPDVVERAAAGDRSPLAMDDENDIGTHYSRLIYGRMIRSIDASHRTEVDSLKEELAEAHHLLAVFARRAVDVKVELIRTKGQMAAMNDPAHLHKIGREETIEAQSFSFPPLKLRHVRTLKLALKRRAENMRRGMDDDLGRLLKRTTSADDGAADADADADADANRPRVDSWREPHAESSSGKADPPALDPVDGNDQTLLQSLLAAKRQNRALEAEKRILEAQAINLRESVNNWKDRCRGVGGRPSDKEATMMTTTMTTTTTTTTATATATTTAGMTETETTAATATTTAPKPRPESSAEVAQIRREVEETWLARWRDRNDQLTQRMRRIDEDAQRSLQQAMDQRDLWIVRCADISTQLRQRDDELARLRRQMSLRNRSGSSSSSEHASDSGHR